MYFIYSYKHNFKKHLYFIHYIDYLCDLFNVGFLLGNDDDDGVQL